MKKKLKLLYICESTGGGVRKNLLDLLMNINMNKFDVYFIYSDIRADDIFIKSLSKLRSRGIKLYKVPMERNIKLLKDIKSFLKISKIIRNIKPDVVHCHSSKAGALGRIAAFINRISSIIYTPHAYIMQNPNLSSIKKKIFALIEKWLNIITSKTINVSTGERDFAIEHGLGKKEKFKVIYNGIKQEHIDNKIISLKKSQLGFNEEDCIIGTTARMDEQKDPFTFIKIACNILTQYPNVKFVYLGDGKFKHDIENLIKISGREENIKLLGFRSDADEIVSVFDIYINTSLYEGMPYSIIEALARGKPILATNVIGNNEVVINDFNGLLFEKQNIHQGVILLKKMINSPELLYKYGLQSYKLFEDNFKLEFMISETENVYLCDGKVK